MWVIYYLGEFFSLFFGDFFSLLLWIPGILAKCCTGRLKAFLKRGFFFTYPMTQYHWLFRVKFAAIRQQWRWPHLMLAVSQKIQTSTKRAWLQAWVTRSLWPMLGFPFGFLPLTIWKNMFTYWDHLDKIDCVDPGPTGPIWKQRFGLDGGHGEIWLKRFWILYQLVQLDRFWNTFSRPWPYWDPITFCSELWICWENSVFVSL